MGWREGKRRGKGRGEVREERRGEVWGRVRVQRWGGEGWKGEERGGMGRA